MNNFGAKQKIKLVSDSNIFISALLRDNLTRHLMLDFGFEIIAPEKLLFEIETHAVELAEKTSVTQEDFFDTINSLCLESKIKFIQKSSFKEFNEYALKICPKGHKDDFPYIALALAEKAILWSNDRELKNQKIVKVISTKELVDLLYE